MKYLLLGITLVVITVPAWAQQTTRDTVHLQLVEIIGRTAKKYNSDYSFSATRTATLNKDIPQAISKAFATWYKTGPSCYLPLSLIYQTTKPPST